VRKIVLTISLLLSIGCATYTSKMELSRDYYHQGRYEDALAGINELVDKAGGNDLSLYLLERGKIYLAAGEYDLAITDLQAAVTRFWEIEGTVSIADLFKNTLLNPGMGEYQPDTYEKILVNCYLLLAYWLKGDEEGAFVERNRIIGRIRQYTDGGAEEERKDLDFTFARYLAALLYEVEGLEDDARIEYAEIERLHPGLTPPAVNPHLTEVAVFTEIGRAPVKVSTEIRGYLQKEGDELLGFFTFPDAPAPLVFRTGVGEDLKIDRPGVLFTFAFPQYIKQERVAHSCKVVIDGIEAGEAVPLDAVEETAMSAFQRKLGLVLLKSAFRTYLKTVAQTKLKDEAGGVIDVLGKVFSAVDRADTRSWQTLPAEIQLFRLESTPGTHEVYIKYLSEDGEVVRISERVTFSMMKGRKGIVYVPGAD